jgi:hypothetical protein
VRHQALRAPQRSDVRLLAGATAHEFNFIWAASDWVTADDVADGLAKAGMSAAGIASYLRPGEDRRPGGIVGQALSDRTFRVPAQEMAAAKTAAGGAAYAYDFRWASPAGPLRGLSFHCLDMPFAFDLLGEAGVREAAGDAPPAALAAELHGAWTRFITEGDPGWPRYNLTTRPVRVLDETSVTLDDPLRAEREAWALSPAVAGGGRHGDPGAVPGSGTVHAQRRPDVLDRLLLGRAYLLASLPVGRGDLVGHGEHEAPVVIALLGGRLVLEQRGHVGQAVEPLVPELLGIVDLPAALHARLLRHDLVEKLALAVLGTSLGVGLRHRYRLPEHPSVRRGDNEQARGWRPLEH